MRIEREETHLIDEERGEYQCDVAATETKHGYSVDVREVYSDGYVQRLSFAIPFRAWGAVRAALCRLEGPPIEAEVVAMEADVQCTALAPLADDRWFRLDLLKTTGGDALAAQAALDWVMG